jgi:hypothetical protein
MPALWSTKRLVSRRIVLLIVVAKSSEQEREAEGNKEVCEQSTNEDARTISSSPACKAAIAMISSGRLPKVAFRRPPIVAPVWVATCSVPCTMSLANGMMARAAQKKITAAATFA